MSSLLNSIYVTWLQFRRQPLFWLLLIGALCYEYLGLSDISFPGNFLPSTSFLVQGGILAFLLFGIFIFQVEDKYKLEDVFMTIKQGFLVKVLAKIIFGMILAFIVSGIFYLFYVIFYLCILDLLFSLVIL